MTFLDGLPHRRVVDDGQQLLEVVDQQPVVEHLVAVVQLVEEDVAGQVGGVGTQLAVGAVGLLTEGFHRRRQPADQSQLSSLLQGEGRAAVGERVGHDGGFVGHGFLLGVSPDPIEGSCDRTGSCSGAPRRFCWP